MTAGALQEPVYYLQKHETTFANPGGRQHTVLTLPPAERYYVNNFVPAAPFLLAGPLPDKKLQDVWEIYQAASAANYSVYLVEGLVMLIGYESWIPGGRYMVFFGGKYHQRFLEASTSDMLFTSKADLIDWLKEHPQR